MLFFSVMGVELTLILSKGLGFVPTPPIPHPSPIEKDINNFAHTLRLKYIDLTAWFSLGQSFLNSGLVLGVLCCDSQALRC